MVKTILLFVASLLVFSGCALNMSLAPETKPLEEKTIEGKGEKKILLIDLDGLISFKEETGFMKVVRKPSVVAFFREAFLKAEQDPDVAAVIVRINSPGGGVAASDTIYHEIVKFRDKRKVPVEAYIMELGASGGYYVASACDRIVASPASLTGSIGVIAVKFNIESLLSKIGVSEETYKSGARKDFWMPFRPSTPEEKKMMQGIIDKLYSRFVDAVYSGRQRVLSRDAVKALSDGRVFTADEALESGLIDDVLYLDEAVEEARKSVHLEEARVVTYERPKTFKSNIYSEISDPAPQIINLLTIDAEDFSLFSGTRFMYLWNP